MSIFEIISAIVLILACVFIIVVVLMKDTKTQMSQQISGTSSDSFYQRNVGRTKDAILNKATIVAAVIFFVLAVAVKLINFYGKDIFSSNNENATSNNEAAVTSTAESSEPETTASETSEEASAADEASEATSAETESAPVDER